MPYDVRKSGDKWETFNKETGETVPGGSHDSEDEAQAHMRALYANVEDSKPEVKKSMDVDTKQLFIPIEKVDMEKREVWGYGVIEQPDAAQEILDYSTSKPEFVKWSEAARSRSGGKSLGNLRAMHQTRAAGKLISIQTDDAKKGIFVGAKIVDDDEWKKVQEGVYTGFSVGGSYLKRWADRDNPGFIRYTAKPVELSLVDAPCIPGATFQMVKADNMVQNVSFQPQHNEPAKLTWEPDPDFPDLGVSGTKPDNSQTIPGNLAYDATVTNMPLPNETIVIPDSVAKDSSQVPTTEALTQAAVKSKEIDKPLDSVALVGRLNKFVDTLPETLQAIVEKEVARALEDKVDSIVRKAVADSKAKETRYVKVIKKD
jgi:hypothetical protein